MSPLTDTLVAEDTTATEEMIARVLRQAHRDAEDLHAPDDARVVLRVAHSFADELATTNPEFDRLRFIESAISGSF